MTRIPVVNRAAFLTRPEHRGLRVIALVSLLVAWEALARTGRVPVLFLPSPLGVLIGISGKYLDRRSAALMTLPSARQTAK